jgi:hypothetical protein
LEEFEFRLAKSDYRGIPADQSAMERESELGTGRVIDRPETSDHSWHAGSQGLARQARKTLSVVSWVGFGARAG